MLLENVVSFTSTSTSFDGWDGMKEWNENFRQIFRLLLEIMSASHFPNHNRSKLTPELLSYHIVLDGEW